MYDLSVTDIGIRFWSVFDQQWVECPPDEVPSRELAAMPEQDRATVAAVSKEVQQHEHEA